ncbi:tyrosine-type recombinase/integrase [Paracoccus ravus]|uniref:tyrosine-type recombinase/integrase n=1 Tax=Paracoccus ravus TaxID=2447760 RepID=UPI0014309CE1|nr:integrase family protein [Paracoccus ravus]
MPIIKKRLTDAAVDKLPFESGKQVEYQDTDDKFIRLIVGAGSKSWIARASYMGNRKYTTVGQYPLMLAKEASDAARAACRHFEEHGVWPGVVKREATLRNALDAYSVQQQVNKRKEATIAKYRRTIELWFSDWFDMPLSSITRAMLDHRQLAIETRKGLPRGVGVRTGNAKEGPAPEAAKMAMTQFKAVFNYACIIYPDANLNPVVVKKLVGAKKKSGKQIIATQDVYARLWTYITEQRSPVRAAYLAMKLYTGLRKPSLSQLQWSDVDMSGGVIHVRNSKRDVPFNIPITKQMAAILALLPRTDSPWVFPSNHNPSGHLVTEEGTGMPSNPHDFRRLWATAAKKAGVPDYERHVLGNWVVENEEAAGYLQDMWDDLVVAQQAISDWIDKQTGAAPIKALAESNW